MKREKEIKKNTQKKRTEKQKEDDGKENLRAPALNP